MRFPTYEEMAKDVAEKALDEVLFDGRSIREWIQIIASEDTISRDKAIVQLSHNKTGDDDCDVIIQKDIETIKALPPVKPAEKVGRWIKTVSENGVTSSVRCSECGFEDNRYMLFRYCPNCGRKMQEVKNE